VTRDHSCPGVGCQHEATKRLVDRLLADGAALVSLHHVVAAVVLAPAVIAGYRNVLRGHQSLIDEAAFGAGRTDD
jgi:hypothetical protein